MKNLLQTDNQVSKNMGLVPENFKTHHKTQEIKMKKQLVAVYGTLKTDNSNFHLMEESGAEHVVTTVTKNKYLMFDGGFPMVNKSPDDPRATPITVEVFRVETLQLLDWLEGHPDHFCREQVAVEASDDLMPWMYFGPKDHGRGNVVEDGNWEEYMARSF